LKTHTSPKENALCTIMVHSIGNAGAGLVAALKQISPKSESKIASLLFQAPAKLLTDLPKKTAEEINTLLQSTGLDSQVVENDFSIVAGDTDHEIALVINDVTQIKNAAQLIIELIGANIAEVRKILFTTPTVLLGKISKNTAETIQKRFEAIGIEVDISNPKEACFDVFLGECSALDLQRLNKILEQLNIEKINIKGSHSNTIVCSELTKTAAASLWDKTHRTNLPVRIINRDFERFDVQLEAMPNTPEAIEYLTSSTGMPEKIAHKALQNLPIILHQNIPFQKLDQHLMEIKKLKGQAKGYLLIFQTFSLKIESTKDQEQTLDVLKAFSGKPKNVLSEQLKSKGIIEGPFTSLQAKWLQFELNQIGTISQRILR